MIALLQKRGMKDIENLSFGRKEQTFIEGKRPVHHVSLIHLDLNHG
ncbi:MAG: hypothetical protein JJU28_18550 [Cyclobacteriaceae bacterium]|nr:hypothetical protein [Cyclobacteriaceae bacterium]